MLDKNTVKVLSAKCDLSALSVFLIDIDDRELQTPNKEDYMALLEEAANQFREDDDSQIEQWAEKVRTKRVMVEL
jgi:hypothetical protein